MIAPPIPYFGGKITAAPRIVSLLPAHKHYVEPFGGSLAVLLAKPRSPMETVNDLDGALMTFWRVLRDQPDRLVRLCALTPHSRAELTASRDLDGLPDLEVARRVFIQLTQGRSATRRGSTGWRYYVESSGSGGGIPAYLAGYRGRLYDAAERLADVTLESRPALDLVERFGRSADVLLYVDPPYLGTARGGTFGNDGYVYEMREPAEHRLLATALRSCKASVVLSGYPSDLYDRELYPDWHRTEFGASTGQGGTWENRTEVLWSNRSFPTDLRLAFDEEVC